MTKQRILTKAEILQCVSNMQEGVTASDVCAALTAALEQPEKPPPLYFGWRRGVSLVVTVISGAAAVVTALSIILDIWTSDAVDKREFFMLYASWAIAPPLWFFLEYTVLFDPLRGNPLRDQDFKTSQDLAQKIWGAFLVLLGVYALVTWGVRFG